MDVLATRAIKYRRDSGEETEVTLTVFAPILTERGDWKCEFKFSPPNSRRAVHVYDVDVIQAFLACLCVARGYIEHPNEDRTSWQGMSHSGLPWHDEIPHDYQPPQIPGPEETPANLDILTKVHLAIPHGENDARDVVLTVYRPFTTDNSKWKCAFGFGTVANETVRYGLGADFIEALLDCLALARITYNSMVPATWEPPESRDFHSVQFWPYKVGREYLIERTTSSELEKPVHGV